jgi:hypothetical protein
MGDKRGREIISTENKPHNKKNYPDSQHYLRETLLVVELRYGSRA